MSFQLPSSPASGDTSEPGYDNGCLGYFAGPEGRSSPGLQMADGQLEWAERPGISLIPFAAVTFVLDSLLPPRDNAACRWSWQDPESPSQHCKKKKEEEEEKETSK
jgi:hypothetical protein